MTDFEDIYNRYAPQIYRVCMGYTNDSDQAKDLVQETFIAVWKNLGSFRNESSISTWIFRIATNNCLRALEKANRVQVSELPVHLPNPVSESPDERLGYLHRAIAELGESERIIISLVLEDLPQVEIAAIVGISHANIRVKVHRIKEKLAQKLKAHGQFN